LVIGMHGVPLLWYIRHDFLVCDRWRNVLQLWCDLLKQLTYQLFWWA